MGASGDSAAAAEHGSKEWFAERGFDRPVGKAHASLYELVTFNWISPLLAQGAKGLITERSAEAFIDDPNRAPHLMAQFQSAYDASQVFSHNVPIIGIKTPAFQQAVSQMLHAYHNMHQLVQLYANMTRSCTPMSWCNHPGL